MNNKHKIKKCSGHVREFKQTKFANSREKKLTTYSFTFMAKVFVKSAKFKYSFFESPENEEVFLELSFCLNVPCVSVNACPPVNNLTVA